MNKVVLNAGRLVALETTMLENRKLHADINWCQNWLSSPSFFRLSDDILFLIFDFCASDIWQPPLNDKDASLWTISQTCRRWRAIALSQPSLWNHITIYPPTDSPRLEGSTSMLQTWIERSCSTPLQVNVLFGDDLENGVESQLMELLINESWRWHHVDLNFGGRTDIYYSLARRASSFPILRYLNVEIGPGNDWSSEDEDWVWPNLEGKGFVDAPNLFKASLSIVSEGFHNPISRIPIITLPWHQLRHHHCVHNGYAELFSIGAQLYNLEVFEVEVYEEDPQSPTTSQLTLPALRYFEFRPETVHNAASFLNNLTLPVLDDFRIFFSPWVITANQESEMILRSIASLLTRSSRQLQILQLDLETFSSPDFSQIVSCIHVRTLRFDIMPSRQPKFELLSRALKNLEDGPLFQGLSTLHLVFFGFEQQKSMMCADIIPIFVPIVTAWRTTNRSRFSLFIILQLDLFRTYYPPSGTVYLEDGPLLDRFLELERGGLILKGSAFSKQILKN